MTTILSKRKRRQDIIKNLTEIQPEDDQAIYQEALRKHFEAAFEPVEGLQSSSVSPDGESFTDNESLSSSTSTASDWEGLSEDEAKIQIVDYSAPVTIEDDKNDLKSLRKRFMSSKPPTEESKPKAGNSKNKPDENGLQSASSLTAEDIALQRLLSESHLLSGSTAPTLLPTLKARQQAQDLRLQSLGAKKPLSALGAGNTPMSIRKGMEAKKLLKEQNRRQEARETGVILERESRTADKDKRRKRARDVGAPAVGKWRGGTLVLGKKDVAEIESQKLGSDFGKRGRKGGKGKTRRR